MAKQRQLDSTAFMLTHLFNSLPSIPEGVGKVFTEILPDCKLLLLSDASADAVSTGMPSSSCSFTGATIATEADERDSVVPIDLSPSHEAPKAIGLPVRRRFSRWRGNS